jgi:two-component system, OmpR family, sensor histidine kinase KdpD
VNEPRPPDDAAGRAEIASKLAHEIRGPVSTLRGLASTALAHYDGLSDEERREFLGLIRHEAERLEATVEQIAIALRLDAGSLRFDIVRQDLVGPLRTAVDPVDVGEHPLEVETPPELEASFDAKHVATVVGQLLRNAAVYSPPDAPISITLRREGSDALLEVVDRGPGVPPERREEVFERFAGWRPIGYEAVPGPGLGLFISRAIVEHHGGTISITDGPQGGTMLSVRLPLEGARGTAGDDAPDL